MIATSSVPSPIITKIIPPKPKNMLQCCRLFDGKLLGYAWNKTAWIVELATESVVFEYRSSQTLTCVAFNGSELFAVGDCKGSVKIFKYPCSPEACHPVPIVDGQILNTDISCLQFVNKDVLAAGGGHSNSASRHFMSICGIDFGMKGFKMLCDGTGGPTKQVNDISCSGNVIAFAADDCSVTLFRLEDKNALFVKTFSDYGGLVGRVLLGDERIAYGSGGSTGRYIVRKICDGECSGNNSEVFTTESHGELYFDENGDLKEKESRYMLNGPKGIIKSISVKGTTLQAFDHVGGLVYESAFSGSLGGIEIENSDYSASASTRYMSVLDKSTKEELMTSGWSSHDSTITSICFLKDNSRKIASVGLDGHMFVWDLDILFKPFAAKIHAHHGPISCVAVSDGGEIMSFGQEDASIRIFKLP